MYKPRKYQRHDTIRHFPKLEDLRRLSADAFKARGCIIELPWQSAKTANLYTLTVIVELAENDSLWTLYVGEGEAARLLWSTPATDLEMLIDVMTLSLPEEVEKAQIPAELSYGAPSQAPVPGSPGFMQAPPPGYAYPPGYAPPANYPYPPGYYPPPGPGYPPGFQPPPGYPLPPGYYPYPSGTYPAVGYPGQGAVRNTGPVPVPYPMPVPPPMPIPPANQPGAVGVASTLPVQAGPPAVSEPASSSPSAGTRGETAPKKRANIMLGQFLVMADLVPQKTLDSALLLQDLVKNGGIGLDQAAEALVKAHNRGGNLESSVFTAKETAVERNIQAPPLGQLLLKAGLVDGGALTAALKFQQAARRGELQKEQALEAFVQESFGKTKGPKTDGPELDKALALLVRVGLLPEQDLQVARNLQAKHGGALMNILTTAGKIDARTLESSLTVQSLLDAKRLKDEQAAIALHYCHRSRVTFDEAIEELGWPKP